MYIGQISTKGISAFFRSRADMGEYHTIEGNGLFEAGNPIYLNIAGGEDRNFMHKHDFIEIVYVCSGKGLHMVGDREYPVSKGDICIINYGVPHAYIKDTLEDEGGLTIYNCVFKPEFIDYSLIGSNDFKDIASSLLFNTFFIDSGPSLNLKLSSAQQLEIEEVYRKMQAEFFTKPKGYLNILRSCLIELLTRLFRYLDASGSHHGRAEGSRSGIIGRALEFLGENYGSSDLNINEVAIRTFLSRSYFSKLFKAATGQSFSRYLQDLRISEACSLLRNTDRKVTDIISDVGFKDTKHFNLLFKRLTGMTPSEYRKSG